MKVGFMETPTNGSEMEDNQWSKEGRLKKAVCDVEEFLAKYCIVNICVLYCKYVVESLFLNRLIYPSPHEEEYMELL
jgi:hypothetical protein